MITAQVLLEKINVQIDTYNHAMERDDDEWSLLGNFPLLVDALPEKNIQAFMGTVFQRIDNHPDDLNDDSWKALLIEACAFVAAQNADYKITVFKQWVACVNSSVEIDDVLKSGPRLLPLAENCQLVGIIDSLETLYHDVNVDVERLSHSTKHDVLCRVHQVIARALDPAVDTKTGSLALWYADLTRAMPTSNTLPSVTGKVAVPCVFQQFLMTGSVSSLVTWGWTGWASCFPIPSGIGLRGSAVKTKFE